MDEQHGKGADDRENTQWFAADERAALDDFWKVYERNTDRIQAVAHEWALEHPELFPHRERLTPSQSEEEDRRMLAALQAAVRGDFSLYRKELGRRGAANAERGVTLRSSCDETRTFMRPLLPSLVESYGSEPSRLAAAIQAMNDLAGHAVAVIAEAYLESNEARVRAREQDLETTLDSIGDAVIVTDARGCVTRMNPVAEGLTGFSFADSSGKPLDAVFRIENEETGAPVESPVPRVLREGLIVGLANHTVLVARDGSRRPIADSGAPIRRESGEVRGVVLVFRDVTEERRAEEALRHWERVFQHATWGVGTASARDVKFATVNPAYAEMHGYTVEELRGQPVSILWTPETKADMERHGHETLEHNRLVVETTHLRKDGTSLPVEVVATTVKNAKGEVEWFVAYVQDITERKRLQQSRLRAIELEAENRRIEEANRLKSEFLANMSHELRTPLNSIIGFAELLHDEQVGPVMQKQKEFLADILAAGAHLLQLINDVLDLAKIEAGKMEFRPEPVDLPQIVRTVVQSLRATVLDKRLNFTVAVDPALEDVSLDPGRFKQVLYNYVSNAVKFTQDGGHIVVRVIPEAEDRLRLEVEDDGIGVAPADVERLFVAFQQLESGATKRHAGTGLGLALTKRLTEAQGGSVGMRSASERGSIFFAVFPRRPPDLGARRADVPPATAVLVVANEARDREVLGGILSEAGYDVTAVASCAEAITAWKEHAYDALTLDVILPDGEDLQALLDLIRKDEKRPGIPVITMTIVANGGGAAGFAVTDVLAKPVDPHALVSALERGGAPPTRGNPVLVVDDDAGSLKLMEATLAKLGYDALCFSDARDALRGIQRIRPLAAIVDLVMPGMDGLAFLERFRASPENQRIPVMIWTVKDLSPDERIALHTAVNSVVQKGVDDSSRLSAALQAFLPAKSAPPTEGER
jgi:PAS domain S-box-containing protein